MIWQAIRRVSEETKKPVIVSIGSMAASGGYYLASAGDYIFADRAAIIGVDQNREISSISGFRELSTRDDLGAALDALPIPDDAELSRQEWALEGAVDALLDPRVGPLEAILREVVRRLYLAAGWAMIEFSVDNDALRGGEYQYAMDRIVGQLLDAPSQACASRAAAATIAPALGR